MGNWGTYRASFKTDHWRSTDEEKYELDLQVLKEFLPFSRCEGGLSFSMDNMFEPEFSVSVRYEGSFPEAKFLATCNRVIRRFSDVGYKDAYIRHDLDWSPDTEFWYLSDSGDCFEYDKEYSEYVTEERRDAIEQLEEMERGDLDV